MSTELDQPVTFEASFPPIASALMRHGSGDGCKVKLDIPELELAAYIRLTAWARRRLRITIEPLPDEEAPDPELPPVYVRGRGRRDTFQPAPRARAEDWAAEEEDEDDDERADGPDRGGSPNQENPRAAPPQPRPDRPPAERASGRQAAMIAYGKAESKQGRARWSAAPASTSPRGRWG
jgi:hypothetical protein